LGERELAYGSETISDDEYWEAGDDEYLELEKQELNPKRLRRVGKSVL